MADLILRDGAAKVQTVADFDLCMRFLKHNCPDGDYSIEGMQTELIMYRIDGVVYPCGGMLHGKTIPPRSKEECKTTFDE